MSSFEKIPATDLRPGNWVIIKGRLSRVASVSGTKVTTDRGYIGDSLLRSARQLSRLKPGVDAEAAARTIHANMGAETRHLGAAQVAEEVGKTRATITASLRRHGLTSARPFPRPAVYIGDVPGWSPDQLPAIRQWFDQPAKGRPRTVNRGDQESDAPRL